MKDVDGVPTLVAKTNGPTRAGLVFRVGRADETLATGGITHLVEHLALHRHGVADYHRNGTTGVTTTSFLTQGTPEAVVAFLHGVCAGLRDLPTARLATEKNIIDAEASGRGRSMTDRPALWRHGARDFGLTGFPEFGIHTLATEQVADWAATRFTRGNAVLWVAGDDIPAGLRLDLPDGKRRALPAESSALPVTPAYFAADADAVLLDATVSRGAASIAYAQLLERALLRERALSDTASVDYSTDGRPRATVTAVADARHGNVDAVLDAFLGRLHALRDAGVAVEELEAVRALSLEQLRSPDVEASRLPRRAVDLLAGLPGTTTEQLIADVEALTVDRIRKVARKVNRSALLMVPESVPRPPAGFTAAPTVSRFAVTGKRHRSRNHHGVVLVHGDDGVSIDTPAGPVTVLFEECAGMLRFPDGGRQLIGHDAIVVAVEPSLYPLPASALAAVDAAVVAAAGPAAIVDLPPRDPDSVPKPARWKAFRTTLRSFARSVRIRSVRLWSNRRLRWSLFVVLTLAGPVAAFVGSLDTGRPLIVGLSVLGLIVAFRAIRRR